MSFKSYRRHLGQSKPLPPECKKCQTTTSRQMSYKAQTTTAGAKSYLFYCILKVRGRPAVAGAAAAGKKEIYGHSLGHSIPWLFRCKMCSANFNPNVTRLSFRRRARDSGGQVLASRRPRRRGGDLLRCLCAASGTGESKMAE